MAIAFVQSASGVLATQAFSGNNTAGNLLIAVAIDIAGPQGNAFTIADSQNNTWVAQTQRDNADVVSTCRLFYALNCKAGANTVTITYAGTVTNLAIHEFSGLTTFDQGAFATSTGLSQDSGPITTTVAAELLFGYEMNTAGGQLTVTAGTGFTAAETVATAFMTQYKIVAATGTYNSTNTTTVGKGGACHWIEEIASFFGASAFVPGGTGVVNF